MPKFFIKSKLNIKKAHTYRQAYNKIKKSNLFDEEFYLESYPHIKESNMDPLVHYLFHGYKESKNPSEKFDNNFYLYKYPNVRESGVNPLVHYVLWGMGSNYEAFPIFPNYSNLNICLKGKKDYFFLVNDSNHELKQYFDFSFKSNFDSSNFREYFEVKRKFFEENNIKYFFFIVPDKSLVCKDYLPFQYNYINRNYNQICDLFPDFINVLTETDYFKEDSHINYRGAKKLSYCYLNHFDNTLSSQDFENLLIDEVEVIRYLDLLFSKNWSYSEEERQKYDLKISCSTIKNKSLINLEDNIPEEFKECNGRKSIYYKNTNNINNLKALIFGDSFMVFLFDYMALYFKETFFYWDHLTLNEELIKYYEPDIIMEIRSERFLENYNHPKWVKDKLVGNNNNEL